MPSVKDLQNALFAALAQRMAEHGFESRARDQRFVRKTPFGHQTFHVSFIKHPHDFDVTADVAIRIDALEDLLNERNATLSKSERKQTHSMGAELGNISEGRQRRWTVASEDDIPQVVSSMISLFESVGLPYLETYSNPERALEVLSGDDQASWLYSPFHDLRAQLAIGLAFALGRHEQLDALIAAKRKFLQDRNDPGLDRFLAFAKDLKDRAALSANMNETPPTVEFSVEGDQGRYDGADRQHPSRPRGDRGGGEARPPALHGGVQAQDSPGGRRLPAAG